MKTKVTLLLSLTFVFLLFEPIKTFCNETGNPLVTNYNSLEYKAHPQNWGIIQDDRGFMYIANGDGVLVYDGSNWELIELPNKVPARVFAKDNQGIIYAAGPNEFGYLQPNSLGKLRYISLIDSIGIKNIGIVREIFSTDSCIYFRTEEYIVRLNGKGFSHWKAKSIFNISFVYNNGFFVLDDENGLFKLVNDSLVLAPSGKEFIKKNFFVAKQLNSEVILVNRIKGLYRYEPDSRKSPKLSHIPSEANEILVNDFVFSGIISDNEEIILGTNSGGCVIVNRNGDLLSRITRETGILQNKIHALYIDKDKNLWLALDKGISKCDYFGPVTFWDEQHNLEGTVETLIRFKGTLYIGSLQGLYFLKNSKIYKYNAGISQTWSFLNYKVPNTNDEKLLIGTVEGIFVQKYGELSNIANTPVTYKLYQSPINPNLIFFGSLENIGILEYKNGDFNFIGMIPNTGNNVRSIEQEPDSSIWISTFRDGVIKITPSDDLLKPKKYEYFTLQSGFTSLKNILIYRLNSELVFATEGGLFQFNKESNTFIPEQKVRPIYENKLNDIFCFNQDEYGNIYLSQLTNEHGTLGYAAKQPNGSYTWNSEVFSKIPSMMLLVTYPESDSTVWVGGSEGLFRVDLSKHQKYTEKIQSFIRKVSILSDSCIFYGNFFTYLNGKRVFSSVQNEGFTYSINYRYNSLTFEYSAPEFSNEAELRYQCFLEGYSTRWTEWTTTTMKEFTNLHEGNYCFKVRAKNIYEIIGEESTFEFTILPPWYRTTIAYIAYVIISILIILLIVKISIRRLKNANILLEKLVRERTEEINQQKEELQAQSEELLAQSEELARNNIELEKLSVVASQTDNFVTILSPYGEIEWVNPAFTRFTGFDLHELKEHKGFTIFEASTFGSIKNLFNQCIETKTSIIYESSIVSKTNETIWLQTTLTPVLNSDNVVVKVIAIDSNITEIKRAHQKTKNMLNEIIAQADLIQIQNQEIKAKNEDLKKVQKKLILSEKMASIGVLTAGIAHEINNPINFIYAGVNSIMRDFMDIEEVLKLLKDIENSSQEPSELISLIIEKKEEISFDDAYSAISQTMNDILYGAQRTAEIVQGLQNFSRSEKENFGFANINKIVEGALVLLRNNYKNRIEIIKDLDPSIPDVECKMGKINQVLINLVSNAIDAIEEKGEIFIKTSCNKHTCTISIKDDGAGISEEILPKIFDPFYTTKEVGHGTGLGLSISYGIIEEHNGKIEVQSQLGKGTEFIITLPIKQG